MVAVVAALTGVFPGRLRRVPGTSAQWQAASGTAGTVRLVETYEFEGMPCGQLLHRIQRALLVL